MECCEATLHVPPFSCGSVLATYVDCPWASTHPPPLHQGRFRRARNRLGLRHRDRFRCCRQLGVHLRPTVHSLLHRRVLPPRPALLRAWYHLSSKGCLLVMGSSRECKCVPPKFLHCPH